MELGFAVPVSGSWATAANIAEVARRSEERGYRSLWTFQRLLSPLEGDAPVLAPQYRSVQDPLAVLAYLAGVTSTSRLGVAVVNAPFYSPIVLAKLLTTIDHLSAGRLDVGLGIGWLPAEMEATGTDPSGRGRRLEEILGCVKAIWQDDVVDHTSPHYRVPRARVDPKPVQRPHPPVLFGGGAEVALRRAGRLADGWISSSQADLGGIRDAIATVRAAAVEAGRDPAPLRFVCRAAVKVRAGQRGFLTGSLSEIGDDLSALAAAGVTETFLDVNFDPQVGAPDADPQASMGRATDVLDAFAPA